MAKDFNRSAAHMWAHANPVPPMQLAKLLEEFRENLRDMTDKELQAAAQHTATQLQAARIRRKADPLANGETDLLKKESLRRREAPRR